MYALARVDMIMERQDSGSGPSVAVAMAAALRRRDALYTTNLTPAELAQLDLSNKASLETLVTVVSAIAMTLITSTVVLRLTVRRYSVGRFFVDDYLVILASVFTLVVCAVVIAATKYGLGQHVWNLDFNTILDQLKVCIQLMFVANILYAAAIAFTKLSIIASYLHIFAPRGLLKTTLYATACVTVGLGVASVPATIFECIPVAGAWSLSDGNAHCYTFVNFLYASTAINVTTDLILCIVPIPLFWRLQLPQRQKIMISVLFFLGGLYVNTRVTETKSVNIANKTHSACIASIIRLAYLHLLYDPIDVTCKQNSAPYSCRASLTVKTTSSRPSCGPLPSAPLASSVCPCRPCAPSLPSSCRASLATRTTDIVVAVVQAVPVPSRPCPRCRRTTRTPASRAAH